MINLIATPAAVSPKVTPGTPSGGQSGSVGTKEVFTDLFAVLLGLAPADEPGSSVFGLAVPPDPGESESGEPEAEAKQGADGEHGKKPVTVPVTTGQNPIVVPAGDLPVDGDGVKIHVVVPNSVSRQMDADPEQPVTVAVHGNVPALEPDQSDQPVWDVRQIPETAKSPRSVHASATAFAAVAKPNGEPVEPELPGVVTRPGATRQLAEEAEQALPGDIATVGPTTDVPMRAQQTRAASTEPAVRPQGSGAPQLQPEQAPKADFSWMLTDPVRRVVSGIQEAVLTQVQVQKVETSDKPASEPTAVAVPVRTDAGISASRDTDAAPRAESRQPIPDLHQRVIDQVVKEVTLHKFQDGSDLTVRLRPPELGSLRIHLVSDAQGVTSQIEASSPQVRSLLQAHLPMLTDALSNAGVRLDSVSVTSAAMNLGAWADNMAQQQSQQQTDTPRRRHGAGGVDSVALNSEPAAAYGLQESVAYSWLA